MNSWNMCENEQELFIRESSHSTYNSSSKAQYVTQNITHVTPVHVHRESARSMERLVVRLLSDANLPTRHHTNQANENMWTKCFLLRQSWWYLSRSLTMSMSIFFLLQVFPQWSRQKNKHWSFFLSSLSTAECNDQYFLLISQDSTTLPEMLISFLMFLPQKKINTQSQWHCRAIELIHVQVRLVVWRF